MTFAHMRTITSCQILLEIVGILVIPTLTLSETCTFVNQCVCKFNNGSVIDLSNIGSKDKLDPSFRDVRPKIQTPNKTFEYFYNPCYSFNLGADSGDCGPGNDIAVCQKDVTDPNKPSFQDCGDQDKVNFGWNSKMNSVVVNYHSKTNRKTNVTLVCYPEAKDIKIDVTGEVEPNSYEITLYTICACPDKCRNDGLSAGSSLVIIFFLFIFFYLFFGIVYMHLVRGASGWELIPHHEFWRDLPLLVRDGCVYVCSGCRRETSYERI